MDVLLFYLLLPVVFSYKILIYNPLMWPSHVKFLDKFADVLVEGEHEVTVLIPEMDKDLVNTTVTRSRKRIIRTPGDPRTQQMMAMSKQGSFRDLWTASPSAMAIFQATKFIGQMLEWQCESLFDLLKIPATKGVISNAILDSTSYAIGEPLLLSYVPGLFSASGEKMNFIERLQNVIGYEICLYMMYYHGGRETEVFRKKYGMIRDYSALLAQTSFIFTNANPYLNFPRPILHKTVMIGGFSVPRSGNETKLPNEWDAILNARKHTVLISFGSFSKSVDMPDEYKQGLLKAFAVMSDVTFIWKYEDPDSDIAASLPNVHLIAWVPQVPLLNDKRLSLFLTHGGLASTTEVAFSGTPAIVVPLLGDQMRNAQMLARHQGALVLHKTDLISSQKLKQTFEEVLNNIRYAENAERLALMLGNQPISPKELLLKHVEFAAKFGRLTNLDPYGRQLSFFQYYLIDILSMMITALMFIIITIVCLVKKCCRRRAPKLKQS